METVVQKWGNSLALRIPSALAKDVPLTRGSVVALRLDRGHILVTPKRRRRPSLPDILELITEDNLHSEADWGGRMGREVW